MRPVEYNPFEEITINERIDELMSGQCWLYVSELTHVLECSSQDTVQYALSRAIRTLLMLNIPVRHHVKEVYRTEEGCVNRDYRLSSLASYLTIINAEPVNPIIARAQLYYVR